MGCGAARENYGGLSYDGHVTAIHSIHQHENFRPHNVQGVICRCSFIFSNFTVSYMPSIIFHIVYAVIFHSYWIWFRSVTEQENRVWHLLFSIGFSQTLNITNTA